ncbi:hypothetical protein RJ639_026948 [Escallonia herrerae]|uniref:adenylate kinase n=1 Tax=Escallonia herrerae TaxID=1293975 RepID=A0AA88X698_9ASTE|nr:hypothetical protein RJ639_026948 [Escallonia herrerae]
MAGLFRLKPPSAALSHIRAVAPHLIRHLRLSHPRFSGTSTAAAAAQPQLDPDYCCYYCNCEEDIHRNKCDFQENEDTEGSGPHRGVQWAFIGAKRHVYAEKLAKLLEVSRISMGSLVRQDLKPSSLLYKQIADALDHGKLVPEEIFFGLLSKRLEDGYIRGETGFILDGIPRTQTQAEILDQVVKIDLVVNFKHTENFSLGPYVTGLSPNCHGAVRVENSTSPRLDISSENTPFKCSRSPEEPVLQEKPNVYANQIKPLEDYYKKQKKLLNFQVGSRPGETWQGLLAALHLQHMNSVHSSLPSGPSWL